jgi:hypothetical protein
MTYLFIAPKLALNGSRPFFVRIFNPYRPELHYMRGPGPACRAKQAALLLEANSITQEIRAARQGLP